MKTTEPDGSDPYLDRAAAANEITATRFPISTRSIRDWPLPETVEIGGRACAPRSEWLAEADRILHRALADQHLACAKSRGRLAQARAILTEQRSAAAQQPPAAPGPTTKPQDNPAAEKSPQQLIHERRFPWDKL